MTQEQEDKANELVDYFRNMFLDANADKFTRPSINCAIKCVDEIIKACEYNHVESWNTDWWSGVKTAINNL